MNIQEWLEQKFTEWEHAQGGTQSYYNFARYLDVNHTSLTQWMSGIAQPAADDLAKIAAKLGKEVYTLPGIQPASQFQAVADAYLNLPAALRSRLDNAIGEAGQTIAQRRLNPESDEAKRLALRIFEKWGFRIAG